jgi:prolyl-tRNA synthetase
LFTLLVKDLYTSYKDLPALLYQIQIKYRDEARPRAGLIRAREFVMKDSYSFDVDEDGRRRQYAAHRVAYQRIFHRLGLPTVIVAALSGAMGGSESEEFIYPTPIGEDTFVRSPGGFAANVEAVTVAAPAPLPIEGQPAAHVEDTPDTSTIESLVDLANARFARPDRPWQAADTLKNVVVAVTEPGGERGLAVIGVPGDREVDLVRLGASLSPAEVEVATDADFARHPELIRGYIGPTAVGPGTGAAVAYLLDPRVVPGTRWITGANQPGRHVFDLVAGRDFLAVGQAAPDGAVQPSVEAAEVIEGDPAPDGSGPLEAARGMEMGHIFALRKKYSEALGLQVLDQNGKQVTVTMGSYGIGVTRIIPALAEENNDEAGLKWPVNIAPAQVHIVATGKDPAILVEAERIARELGERGIEVLVDDRPKVSPGVKFADAELLGMPFVVVVGRGLAAGTVELRDRRTGAKDEVPVGEIVAVAAEAVAGAVAASRLRPDEIMT